MHRVRACMGALTVIALAAHLHAGATLHTAVSGDSITIGDRIQFTVSIHSTKGARVSPPPTESGFGEFVVKEWDLDRQEGADSDTTTFTCVITTYTTGLCSIPALSFFVSEGEAQDTLFSDAVPILVASVINTDSAAVRDIKPQMSAGRPSLLWLWLLLGLAVPAVGVLLGRYFWLRGRKPPPPPPPKPPYEEAIEALRALESRDYPRKGMAREFVFELSEILKRYIGRRYETNALECTTEELLDWVAGSPLNKKERTAVEWIFNTAHPVKFARLVPEMNALDRMGDEARTFLNSTRPGPRLDEARAEEEPQAGESVS